MLALLAPGVGMGGSDSGADLTEDPSVKRGLHYGPRRPRETTDITYASGPSAAQEPSDG